MKKVLAWVLCLMLTLGMVGAASAEFAPVAKEDVKVGFIFIGDVSDKGYTTPIIRDCWPCRKPWA